MYGAGPGGGRCITWLVVAAAWGCGSTEAVKAGEGAAAESGAPESGTSDAGLPSMDACTWPSSAVTESASALYLASTGYKGAPPVYQPPGSLSDVESLRACLKVAGDGGSSAVARCSSATRAPPLPNAESIGTAARG